MYTYNFILLSPSRVLDHLGELSYIKMKEDESDIT